MNGKTLLIIPDMFTLHAESNNSQINFIRIYRNIIDQRGDKPRVRSSNNKGEREGGIDRRGSCAAWKAVEGKRRR